MTAVMLTMLVGCSNERKLKEGEVLFSEEGMSIILTDAFEELSTQLYAACYDSEDVAVFVVKDEFSANNSFSGLALDEYAELVHSSYLAYSPADVEKIEGITCIEYRSYIENDNITYVYLTTLFKGSDAFWQIQFSCMEEKYEEYKPQFIRWAKTVETQ